MAKKKKSSFASIGSIVRSVAKQTQKTAKSSNKKTSKQATKDTKTAAQSVQAAAKAAQVAAQKAAEEKARKKATAQKVAQASLQLTKMRNDKKKTEARTKLNADQNKKTFQTQAKNKKSQPSWRDKLRADGQQAVKKAKQTDALGAKMKTKSYKTNTGMAKGLARVGAYATTYGDAKKDLDNTAKYGELSSGVKKQILKEYMSGAKKDIDKTINKSYPDRLKYRNLTSDEYLRLQNAERLPNRKQKNAALGKDLAKTVGSLNTAALKKGKFASGAMEGMNMLPVSLDRMGSGTYSEGEKLQNRKSKDSKAYKAGVMAGQVGSYFLGGGLGAGESGIAKAALKSFGAKQTSKALAKGIAGKSIQAGAKTGLKVAGKGTAKRLVRGELDDATRAMISTAAKNATKTAGKNGTTAFQRFAAGRIADAAVSSPLNASDAIKSATDETGKVNWNEAGKSFAINTGMDLVVGGGLDVGTKAVSKLASKDMQKLVKIMAKQKSGIALSKSESNLLQRSLSEARNNVVRRAEQQAVDELRSDEKPFTALPEVKSVEETQIEPKIQTQEVKSGAVNVKSAEPEIKTSLTASDVARRDADSGERLANIKTDDAPATAQSISKEDVEAYFGVKSMDDLTPAQFDEAVQLLDNYNAVKERSGARAKAPERSMSDAGSRTVKAIQNEQPELKTHIQDEARVMLGDLKQSTNGEVTFSKTVNEQNNFQGGYYGTKRVTTDDIAFLRDEYKYSYDQIEKGLNDIIEGGSKADNAVSKRIELLLDERLRNGYTDILGERVPANEAYISKRVGGDVTDINSKEFNEAVEAGAYDDIVQKKETKANDEAIARHIESMRKNGFTDDDILDQLEQMGADPQKAIDMVENTPVSKVQKEVIDKIKKDPKAQEKWTAESRAAYDNADRVVMAKTAGEQMKKEHPPVDDVLKDVRKVASAGELGRNAMQTKKLFVDGKSELESLFNDRAADGAFGKVKGYSQADAKAFVEKEIKEDFDECYQAFIHTDVMGGLKGKDAHITFARAKALADELSKRYDAGDGKAAEMMMHVLEKSNELASYSGRALNAVKLLLKTTPEGKVRIAMKDIDRLNERFASRLNGKKLELTKDQAERILNASDDEIMKVLDDINKEIWEQIPATMFEKFNEIRHLSMLGNLKTHERNIVGNMAFKAIRSLSDGMEIVMNKMAKGHIEKLGGSIDMVKVSHSEVKKHKKFLKDEFDQAYKYAESNKMIESVRPEGMTAVEWKALRGLVNTNYKLLEKEDMITFEPEFKNNYVRWCKSKKWDINNLTDAQKTTARNYALAKAEYATFRDTTKFSSWLTGVKQKTEGRKGQTRLGTAGYRVANLALESSIPFVKTPVNVFRRAVDFSPLSLIRATTKLYKQTDPELFKQGLHDLATGLTGTGVFGLGIHLASMGFVTVKAGNVSGDEYYDRDMGYQDYSLNIHFFNGKEYSWTIDWLSPMQSSFFMGAQVWNTLSKDGWQAMDIWNCLTAMTGPMLDMSFMSGTKDTVENFIDQAYRQGNGEADWTSAAFQALFGSVPQGYLNGFVPQVMSQTAGAFDSKMRDTRSTKESPLAKSWDSWRRKLINRVPGLRNKLLNPKIDRFGNDVENGDNIVTRLFQSYANPANVKTINLTKTDKKIISIYNHMEDGDDKKYFYYNFTGNPSYDLGNGKRMTYDEAYKFGKESRRQQTKSIQEMFKASSYKNMTWKMRASELNDAHWIGQTCADLKTYGAKFAADRIGKNSDTDKEARKAIKMLGGSDKDFVNFYIQKERLIARSHSSDYYVKAMAVALSGNDKMGIAYGIHTEKVKAAKEYLNVGGSMKEFTNASCNIASGIAKADVSKSTSNKAFSAANFKINERTYRALGISEQKANMGVGLKNFGYTFKALTEHKFMSVYQFDADESGTLNKKECIKYIDSLGLSSNEEKACLFEYLKGGTTKNPYGRIPNYLKFEKTDKTGSGRSGYSGYSHRRSGRRRSGGSSGGSSKKTSMPSWDSYVKDALSNSRKSSSVTFKDWDSPIDSSFKSKTANIRKKTTARM